MKKKVTESIDDIIGNVVDAQTKVARMKPTYSLELASKFRKGLEGTRFESLEIHATSVGMHMTIEDTENHQVYNVDITPAKMDK